MSVLIRVLLCSLLSSAWIAASAAPIAWAVDNLGRFTYDADTNNVLSWEFPGQIGPGCGAGTPYCPGVPIASLSNGGTLARFYTVVDSIHYEWRFEFAAPLTDAGTPTQTIPGACKVCDSPFFAQGAGVSGSGFLSYRGNAEGYFQPITVPMAVEPVPEPAAGFAAGLLGLTITIAAVRRVSPSSK